MRTTKLCVLLILGAAGLLGSLARVLATGATTVVVSPVDMNGWVFVQETPVGSGQMVIGPSSPPLGEGSANLVVNSTGGMALGIMAYPGVRLADVETLRYSTYRSSGSSALAVSLQLQVDDDLNDDDSRFKGRLVFEPYYTATVQTGVWQTWNPTAEGKWWGTREPFKSACPIDSPCTWQGILETFPNAGFHPIFGGILFKAGSGWASGFDGNVDAFTIGIRGLGETTYDFEQIRPVMIDIKPGSFPNSINPRSRGRIPVAILTTDAFDASDVDPSSVRFGRTGVEATAMHAAFQDVDGDGRADVVFHFDTQTTGIRCGDEAASLTGRAVDGVRIQGYDAIATVGCKQAFSLSSRTFGFARAAP